jgi:hypothetical protein
MSNKFGIPDDELQKIRTRDKLCIYCHKEMIFPFNSSKRKDCATIEHLNFDGPFYWGEGLQTEDIVICCGSCNSSRGIKKLSDWFRTKYCFSRNINENTVADPVKAYLNRKKN